jgi:hypothetical protein
VPYKKIHLFFSRLIPFGDEEGGGRMEGLKTYRGYNFFFFHTTGFKKELIK